MPDHQELQACQTPLVDLLRSIPADARMVYEVSPTESHNIPVGRLCADALAEIERLQAGKRSAPAVSGEAVVWRKALVVALGLWFTDAAPDDDEVETVKRWRAWVESNQGLFSEEETSAAVIDAAMNTEAKHD